MRGPLAAAAAPRLPTRGGPPVLLRRAAAAARVTEAAALLVASSAAQRWVPMSRWGAVLGAVGPIPEHWLGRPVVQLPTRTMPGPERLVAVAIRRGSRVLPWQPSCLAQAAAAQVMLRTRNQPGVVVIGLRSGAAPERGTDARPVGWDTHAWLLGARGAITGGPAATGFTATTVFEVPGGLRAADLDSGTA